MIVTGGAGYIGSHTVLALNEAGYEPIILDNFSTGDPSVISRLTHLMGHTPTFFYVDCTDYEAGLNELQELGPIHGLIHFAAYKAVGESMQEPIKYYQNNLESCTTVLRWCRRLQITQLVFSSSCTVYGQPDALPVTEESPIKPAASVYGYTKQVCEQMLKDARLELPELRVSILRYFNPIGAHPSGMLGELPLNVPNNLVPFLTQAVAGLRPPLTVFGTDYDTPDGSCVRDYIHVVDLAEAHVAALRHLQQHDVGTYTFNIGTGQGASVLELIRTFERVNNLAVPHRLGTRRPGDVAAIFADVSKAQQQLQWRHRYGLADALRHAWAWQQQLDAHG